MSQMSRGPHGQAQVTANTDSASFNIVDGTQSLRSSRAITEQDKKTTGNNPVSHCRCCLSPAVPVLFPRSPLSEGGSSGRM